MRRRLLAAGLILPLLGCGEEGSKQIDLSGCGAVDVYFLGQAAETVRADAPLDTLAVVGMEPDEVMVVCSPQPTGYREWLRVQKNEVQRKLIEDAGPQ